MTLTSHERVECALHHREPDRVPWDAQFNIYTYAAVCRHLGLPVPKNPRSNVNSTVGNSLDLTEALEPGRRTRRVGTEQPRDAV